MSSQVMLITAFRQEFSPIIQNIKQISFETVELLKSAKKSHAKTLEYYDESKNELSAADFVKTSETIDKVQAHSARLKYFRERVFEFEFYINRALFNDREEVVYLTKDSLFPFREIVFDEDYLFSPDSFSPSYTTAKELWRRLNNEWFYVERDHLALNVLVEKAKATAESADFREAVFAVNATASHEARAAFAAAYQPEYEAACEFATARAAALKAIACAAAYEAKAREFAANLEDDAREAREARECSRYAAIEARSLVLCAARAEAAARSATEASAEAEYAVRVAEANEAFCVGEFYSRAYGYGETAFDAYPVKPARYFIPTM